MILWIDAQLSPHLAPWISEHFAVDAVSARRLGLQAAHDRELFVRARAAGAVVMTKDQDFVILLEQEGPPPQVLWITAGNTSNEYLKTLLKRSLVKALEFLSQGESLVELSDSPSLTLVR